jgi:hypothetical protein
MSKQEAPGQALVNAVRAYLAVLEGGTASGQDVQDALTAMAAALPTKK